MNDPFDNLEKRLAACGLPGPPPRLIRRVGQRIAFDNMVRTLVISAAAGVAVLIVLAVMMPARIHPRPTPNTANKTIAARRIVAPRAIWPPPCSEMALLRAWQKSPAAFDEMLNRNANRMAPVSPSAFNQYSCVLEEQLQ
jgi:hypothetical protein